MEVSHIDSHGLLMSDEHKSPHPPQLDLMGSKDTEVQTNSTQLCRIRSGREDSELAMHAAPWSNPSLPTRIMGSSYYVLMQSLESVGLTAKRSYHQSVLAWGIVEVIS